ncbi:MAG TPA: M20 family metallopeptidase [Actinomycetota bacterium]|nr:M20 family metallopeptidase [Actinomycetota bacterium]
MSPRLSPRDLLAPIEARQGEFVEALRQLVSIDSGTYTPEGVNRIADLCEARFVAGGWRVERHPNEPPPGKPQLGDVVIGRLEGSGGPRILLIGHMDTVFDAGTAEARPFRVEGERAFGPGVSDMKGGLLLGFFAVEALQEAGIEGFGSITYICNPDEEIGSPFSRRFITEAAGEADVALVLEAARANGDIVSARKGVTDARISIRGRAAHAGVEPEKGRSAVLEAIHKALALQAMNERWPDVTLNVGVIGGGTRPNVVPEHCSIEVDLRAATPATLAEAEEELRRIAGTHTVPDVEVDVVVRSWHLPLEPSERSAQLAGVVRQVAGALGIPPPADVGSGGASDGNTTGAAGLPTLDGLGPIGGGWHGPSEWMDLASVPARCALLAGVLAALAEGRSGRSA